MLLTILITVNITAGSISLTAKSAYVLSAQSTEQTICSMERQHVSRLSYFRFIKTTGNANQGINFSFKDFLFAANHLLRVQFNENLRLTKTLNYLKTTLFYDVRLVSERQHIPSNIF
ncbi:MAG TPA: hypothetical protein VK541_15305 [Pedobacter sp.]|uniref:hypothetical protein n=1 Tax=Pedobacter sp. TaxID=1411316 RepID=UPI002CC560CC|nr:hypothetical protein [Pedobacter sp.]HMI03851.1 hypothetical protein [Pedobacter sp.]